MIRSLDWNRARTKNRPDLARVTAKIDPMCDIL